MRVVSVSVFGIAASLLLCGSIGGCGGTQTLQELYAEALVTEDWSKVEAREAKEKAREARDACFRARKTLLCNKRKCRCVDSSKVRRIMTPSAAYPTLSGSQTH